MYAGDFQQWANISYNYSKSNVYPGVVPGEPLSDEYKTTAEQILKSQIMYGGYRLNLLLQSIYGQSSFMQ